jgi:PAS domain S-box-containing protein
MNHRTDAARAVNILVVDDDARNRLALKAILSATDCHVIEAGSGPEALKCLVREDFALVLLDVVMPGMDGFEVASLIRERPRTRATPIIFLTGRAADVASVNKAYTTGAVDYLVKPLDRDIVRAKVEVFVELHRHREEVRRQAELAGEAERRRLELEVAELRLADERGYRRLVEAIPQIVWTAASDGNVEYYSPRWFEYTGLTAEQGACAWQSALHPDDVARCLDGWHEAVRSGKVYEAACRLMAADGSFRWHINRAVTYRAPGGGTGWLGTFTDVDEVKRLLDDRTRLHREAQEALRARDEFLSAASHELKAPITPLDLQIQSILRRTACEGEVPEWVSAKLRVAARQVGRLSRLIDELLDVTRFTAGRLQLELEQVDLSALVRDVVEHFGEELVKCRSPVAVHTDTPAVGRWDRLRVEQIATNLLSNAIKYGAGAPIEITVGVEGGAALLVVRDHGIGIAPDDVTRIFERFERTAAARHREGLGLGLYIVRRLVEAHGGSIRVASSPGAGSTFTVELPLESASHPHQPPDCEA